ncbi:hypothetical protein Anas_08497 [Armadillidium nasatum]|uniref:Uncharacterized protein n=1 Tax=Armadillidium nasatum TaxID=96803 RepID=A0A5N5SQW5_9CRUS|nr:hypothetical protein Anas_08497 [Armadillidium nasatum]
MMQQHQAMIGQSMPQTMPQLHQGMGQLSFQGMRPGYRPNMAGTPMNNMMTNMNQQTIPGNLSSMKGTMVQGNGMSSIPVTIGVSMGQGVGPNGGIPGSQVAAGGASMGMMNTRPTMMQRTRPPNVNMGIPGMGMSTQMPPSRPEWRQMMMQQNQGGIMMGPGIRHGYQQIQQSGTMMGQGNQMIPMQRSQAHMMGMMSVQQNNPNIQHGSGPPMQGGGNMSASLNNPGMQSMQMGGRMPQHSMSTMAQNQVHLGMQMGQPGMQDVRNTNMSQQGHVGSPSNISQVAASNSNSMIPVGTAGGHSSLNAVGNSVTSGLNHISSTNMSHLAQQGGRSNLPSIRNTNPNHGTQQQHSLGMTSGTSIPGQHVQSLNQSGPNIANSQPGMMSKNISCSVSGNAINANANTNVMGGTSISQRPDSRGGGNVVTKNTVDPNISTHPPSNANTDFDIVFNDGEFAALLN